MIPEQETSIREELVTRWPSRVSIAIWGLIGLVAGVVVGALGVEIAAPLGTGGITTDVRVEVFGVVLRQGTGPEPMSPAIWTWGTGLLAMFGAVGAGTFLAARVLLGRVASRLGQSPDCSKSAS